MRRQTQKNHAEAERRENMLMVEHTFYIDAWVVVSASGATIRLAQINTDFYSS